MPLGSGNKSQSGDMLSTDMSHSNTVEEQEMPISHQCPQCKIKMKLKSETAGRKIRCPGCRAVSRVGQENASTNQMPRTISESDHLQSAGIQEAVSAAAANSTAADSQTLTRGEIGEKIERAFQGARIEPVRVTLVYRLGTALAAMLMVLLPLIYVAMIVMVALVVFQHGSSNWVIVQKAGEGTRSARAMVGAFMLYLAPILGGVTLVFFMLKPFFAGQSDGSGRRSLKPSDEPELFDFVRRICRAVHAPTPSRIDVDCDINASARFQHGLFSFHRNDLVLTIGLPLVAGMSVRQFGGVLAHEFGHFSQGAGMRLSFVIRTINYWFLRVVYERDHWDERLEQLSGSLDIRVGWILYFVRFCIWSTRRILWGLMMTGDVVCSLLLRQMEFDADRYESRFAGSRTFATTARQLHVLGVAHRWALSDLQTLQTDGRLADNFPRLILANVSQLTEQIHSAIDEQIIESRTGVFDSHPCDRERIANAAAEKSDGIFQLEFPAAELFRNYDQIARRVTWDFYREELGDTVQKKDLYPVEQLLERLQEQENAWKALRRFFQDQFASYRPLPSLGPIPVDPRNPRLMVDLLSESRDQMLVQKDRFAAAWKTYDECDTWEIEAFLAENLQQAGQRVAKDEFSRPLPDPAAVESFRQELATGQTTAATELESFEQAAAERLRVGLLLAGQSHFRVTLAKSRISQDQLSLLRRLLRIIDQNLPAFIELRNCQIAAARLLAAVEESSSPEKVYGQIQHRMRDLARLLEQIEVSFADLPYPFDHSQRDMLVSAYLVTKPPNEDEPGELYETAEKALENLAHLQRRVLGRLCQAVEAVESAVGLQPLPDPIDELDEDEDDT